MSWVFNIRSVIFATAWTPRSDSDRLIKLKTRNTTEEKQNEEHVRNDFVSPGTKPSLYDSTSPSSQPAGPSFIHTPPGEVTF